MQETKKYDREVSCDLIHAVKVNAVDAVKSGVKWNEHASGFIQAMYPQWNMNFDLGGTVVAGTDTPAGVWNIPGMALHRELELFVEAGFSEMDALRSATCVAAKALYKNNLGSIKEGALADIVILNSNPIEDMRNTKAIDSVIKGGRVYSQADILESVPTEDYSKRILEEFLNEFEKQ